MKVLWLTNDRTNRVHDFFIPLETELRKHPDVYNVVAIRRPLPCLEGEWCRRQVVMMQGCEQIVDPDFANTFDIIVTDAMYSYLSEDWGAITTPRAVMWGDNHGSAVKDYIERAWLADFNIFLPLYWCSLQQHLPWLVDGSRQNVRLHWLPYWVNDKIFHDYEEPKRFHVLMTGVVHKSVYPLRWKADDELKHRAWYHRVERPPEHMQREGYWPVGVDYARLLNSAHVCITDTSKHKYPLGKIFEIPGSRSALACDWNSELQMLGFEPNENFFPLSTSDSIAHQIARFKNIDAVTQRGYDFIHQRHSAQQRARDLYDILAREIT